MDTTIFLFIVFGFIIWFDTKRRSKTITQRWQDVGGKLNAFSKPQPKIEPVIELKFMNSPEEPSEYHSPPYLAGNDSQVDENEDDIIIKEVVKEVITQKIDTTDAESALRKLGYKQKEITKAMKIVRDENLGRNISTEKIVVKAFAILNS